MGKQLTIIIIVLILGVSLVGCTGGGSGGLIGPKAYLEGHVVTYV